MRQYGEVPPWLSTATPPRVLSTIGLGVGGGAGVYTPDGQGFGYIELQMGSNPSVGGSVALSFAQQPPVMFFAPERTGLGTLTATDNDGAHTIIVLNWSAQPSVKQKYRIDYEWAVSK